LTVLHVDEKPRHLIDGSPERFPVIAHGGLHL